MLLLRYGAEPIFGRGKSAPERKMADTGEEASIAIASHPEEIKSVFDMRVGEHITLQGSFRITPAGVICTGIAVAAVAFALGIATAPMRRGR